MELLLYLELLTSPLSIVHSDPSISPRPAAGINSLIQQLLVEHLLCARPSVRPWEFSREQKRHGPCPLRAHDEVGEMNMNNIIRQMHIKIFLKSVHGGKSLYIMEEMSKDHERL